MAILIPSKNIYEKDNDKIRDNVIDRIEVGAVEVVPDNEYDTPVYNEKIQTTDVLIQDSWQDNFSYYGGERAQTYYGVGAVVGLSPFYKKNISIKIPKLKNNHYISKLFTGKKINETTGKEENQIKYSIEYKKFVGTCSIVGSITATGAVSESSVTSRNFSYGEKYETSVGEIPKTIEREEIIDYWKPSYEKTTATKTLDDLTNFGNKDILTEETEDYWQFKNIIALCGVEIYSAGFQWVQGTGQGNTRPSGSITLTGKCEKYVPVSIEFTIYGNTIGIDLVDKTVYIPDETGNKPFSVEGNELMQTTNEYRGLDALKELVRFEDYAIAHYEDLGHNEEIYNTGDYNSWDKGMSAYISIKNAKYYGKHLKVRTYDGNTEDYHDDDFYPTSDNTFIYVDNGGYYMGKVEVFLRQTANEFFYSKTKEQYANGKETATIRCSISDYYDYDTKEKIISIDGSTKKMVFDIYDKVIPMAYGANGKDKPLSRYKNGKPKVFQVLGSRIFYDGAVWQELTLQENTE